MSDEGSGMADGMAGTDDEGPGMCDEGPVRVMKDLLQLECWYMSRENFYLHLPFLWAIRVFLSVRVAFKTSTIT